MLHFVEQEWDQCVVLHSLYCPVRASYHELWVYLVDFFSNQAISISFKLKFGRPMTGEMERPS